MLPCSVPLKVWHYLSSCCHRSPPFWPGLKGLGSDPLQLIASKKAYFKQKSLVEKASRNAKKDLVRDLESKGVEVVTIQSGRHISLLAAESDVAVEVPSKVRHHCIS
eukprot:g72746.t1